MPSCLFHFIFPLSFCAIFFPATLNLSRPSSSSSFSFPGCAPLYFLSLPSTAILLYTAWCCKLFKKAPCSKRKINYGDNPISLVRTAAKLPHSLVICFVNVGVVQPGPYCQCQPQNKRHHFPLKVFLLSRIRSKINAARSHPRLKGAKIS